MRKAFLIVLVVAICAVPAQSNDLQIQKGWGAMTSTEVIAFAEAMIGMRFPKSVPIFCNDSKCGALAADIEDAFTIIDVDSAAQISMFELDVGIRVGPPGEQADKIALALIAATHGRLPVVADLQGVDRLSISIGGRPNTRGHGSETRPPNIPLISGQPRNK